MLLTQPVDQVGQLRLGQGIDEVGGGHPGAWVEPHIEGTIQTESETPIGRVELEGRKPEVEEHAVNGGDSDTSQQGVEMAEVSMHEVEAIARPGLSAIEFDAYGLASLDRGRIGIYSEYMSRRSGRREQGATMSSPTERPIDIEATEPRKQRFHRPLQENGHMATLRPMDWAAWAALARRGNSADQRLVGFRGGLP